MILVRAPLRISFIGGGTDLPDFYKNHYGCVISTTINQHVYLAIKHTEFINKIIVKYSTTETVDRPHDLVHNRVREALLSMNIHNNIEIGSFASIPARTGLGSSSSFTVALLKGLHLFKKKSIKKHELAEKACQIEMEYLGEPIGKQDQYAATFGGLNIFEFKQNDKVKVRPFKIPKAKEIKFQSHLLLFFTGMTRDAGTVLSKQNKNIPERIHVYKEMVSLVPLFCKALQIGNMRKAGDLLHKSWLLKRSLAQEISNTMIDRLYTLGLKKGAWGGKVLGAGGGGCILFLAPRSVHDSIRKSMMTFAKKNKLKDFAEIPVEFENKGVEIVFDHDKKN
jgi:D-glycero-alpha-D-manno-heptose-7-phosphate kinase